MSSTELRLRHVESVWAWLPAFRVVAEVEHLGKAAKLLCVSPSALSRTVRLLEEAMPEPLFLRDRGRLILTPTGVALLEATRAAMRMVDDGLAAAQDAVALRCRVGVDELTATLLGGDIEVPGLDVSRVPDDVANAVHLAALDLAIVTGFTPRGRALRVEPLGHLARVCVGPGTAVARDGDLALSLSFALAGRDAIIPAALAARLSLAVRGEAEPVPVLALRRRRSASPLETRVDAVLATLRERLSQ